MPCSAFLRFSDKCCRGASTTAPAEPDGHSGTAAVAIHRAWVSDKACRGASTTAPAEPDGHSGKAVVDDHTGLSRTPWYWRPYQPTSTI